MIVASFDNDIYQKLVTMRIRQLEKQSIDYVVLYDTPCPEGFVPNKHTLIIDKVTNPDAVNSKLNPHMLLKFLKGLEHVDESKYDYIIRVNVSTFIDFKGLTRYLENCPRVTFTGGHRLKFVISDWPINNTTPVEFISGTCMIFSKDVISFIKNIPIKYMNELAVTQNDDVILSYVIKEYITQFTDIPMLFLEYNDFSYSPDYFLYRVKNCYDRKNDILFWQKLLFITDQISLEQ